MTRPKKLPCGRPRPTGAEADLPQAAERRREQLRAHLEKEGLKNSKQRWKIAQVCLAAGEHLSAQEIIRRVEREHPEIGAATVYRSIKTLCEANILRETLLDGDGRVVYEPFLDEHHDHIVCTDCGAIFEFHEPKIEMLQQSVATKLGFEEVRHRHVIYARCRYKK